MYILITCTIKSNKAAGAGRDEVRTGCSPSASTLGSTADTVALSLVNGVQSSKPHNGRSINRSARDPKCTGRGPAMPLYFARIGKAAGCDTRRCRPTNQKRVLVKLSVSHSGAMAPCADLLSINRSRTFSQRGTHHVLPCCRWLDIQPWMSCLGHGVRRCRRRRIVVPIGNAVSSLDCLADHTTKEQNS